MEVDSDIQNFSNGFLLWHLRTNGSTPRDDDYKAKVYSWATDRFFPNQYLTCSEKKWLQKFSFDFDKAADRIWKQRSGKEEQIKRHHGKWLDTVINFPALVKCTCHSCNPPEQSQRNPNTAKRDMYRQSLKIRTDFDSEAILHAALLTLEKDGHEDAKYVFKKLLSSLDTLGSKLKSFIDDPYPKPIRRTPEQATAFLLAKVYLL